MPLAFFETVHYKLRALTGANPVHDIGVGFADLAEDVDKALYEGNKVAAGRVYGAQVERAFATEYEPSSTRATQVLLEVFQETSGAQSYEIKVGGIKVGTITTEKPGIFRSSVSLVIPAGTKWELKSTGGSGTVTLWSSYLPL
jgi:hypothetical protein